VALDRKLIRAGTTVDQMVRAIADEILTGKLRPGDRLDEASLADRFGVSRTPVRDALGQLSAMSLVDRRPNRGAIVMVMTQDHLASMFESMAELEAICARFSAERMTPAERAALESVHYASRNLVRGNAEEAYDAYNFHFHTRLYEGAHNAHIRELAMMTRSRLAPFRRAQFRLRGRLMKSWEEHDAIVTAIMRANATEASEAARAHVATVSDASAIFASPEHDPAGKTMETPAATPLPQQE
jgi:DNA-binding GntR family transcriptional regulator